MKYLSLIAFVVIIGVSQFLVSASNNIPYQTHSSIQSELKKFIQNYIEEHIENLKDFKILNFRSEMAEDNVIKVYFNYNFKVGDSMTGVSRTELNGLAILTKVKDKENEWSLDSVQVEDQKLDFEDPIIITPENPIQAPYQKPPTEEPKTE